MTQEHELKYSIRELASLEAWLDRHLPPVHGSASWRDVTHDDLYFDTADHALEAAGYGARLRRGAGRTVVGLKAMGKADGALHARQEVEAPATSSLSPADWPPSAVRQKVQRLTGGRPLIERFSLRQRRRERVLELSQGTVVLSLDRVTVRRHGRRLGRFAIMEAELHSGDVAALQSLAESLQTSGLVHAEARAKFHMALETIERAER